MMPASNSKIKIVALAATLAVSLSSSAPYQRPSLEKTLSSFCSLQIQNPTGDGTLYLIGQAHAQPIITEKSTTSEGAYPELGLVQAQIYHALLNLIQFHNLNLIVGEGLPIEEFNYPYHTSGLSLDTWKELREDLNSSLGKTALFFDENPKQVSYTTLKLLHPQVTIFGVDDQQQMAGLLKLDRKIFPLAQRYLSQSNPQYSLFDAAMEPILAAQRQLNDQRSRIYLSEALRIADERSSQNVALIIGAAHLSLMQQEYRGSRRLVIMFPHSLPPSENKQY